MATWVYMPSGNGICCDQCVPRGCSCNIIYCDELDDEGFPKPVLDESNNYVEETDQQGRLLPCCEWCYNEFGIDESEFD